MTPEAEALVTSCNNMTQLRKVAESKPDLVQAVQDSIEPIKILLTGIIHRLKLKDKPFSVFTAASEFEQKELWLELEKIDKSLQFNEKYRKKRSSELPTSCAVSQPLLQESALFIHHKKVWCFIMLTL